MLLLVLWVFDAIQIIVPVTVTSMDDNPLMHGVLQFFHPIVLLPGIPAYGDGGTLAADSLFIGVAVTIAFGLVLELWAWLDAFRDTGYRPQWRIRALRFFWRLVLLGFSVPIAGALTSPFYCGSTVPGMWMDTTAVCWAGTHLAYVAGAVVLMVLYVPLSFFTIATFIDSRPDYSGKRNVYSSPTGRVEVGMGIVRWFAGLWFVYGNDKGSQMMQPVLFVAGGG